MTKSRISLRSKGSHRHVVLLLAGLLCVFASSATAGDEDGVAGYKIKIYYMGGDGIDHNENCPQTVTDDGLAIEPQSERHAPEMVTVTHYLRLLIAWWLR